MLDQPTIGTRLHTVGEPPHRDRAEHEERRRRRRDEHDRALADPERSLDLGPEHVDRRALELVEREQQPEHDEHELAAGTERVRERHRLGVDARKQLVREDDLLAGALVRLLAFVFFFENRRRERRRAPLAALRVLHHAPQPASRSSGSLVAGSYLSGVPSGNRGGYCRWVASAEAPQVFGPGGNDRAAARPPLPRAWVGRRRRRGAGCRRGDSRAGWTRSLRSPTARAGVLQHFERTDAGPVLCRSENFVPVHAALRTLLCTWRVRGGRGCSPRRTGGSLQGEGQLQASRRGRLFTAPGRSGLPDDRRARLRDGRRRRRRRVERRPRDRVVLLRHRAPPRRAWLYRAVRRRTIGLAARALARGARRSGSTAEHRIAAAPTALDQPRRALYPTYNAAREGDHRVAYYDTKRAAFATAPTGDRVRVSLIGDFEGRAV